MSVLKVVTGSVGLVDVHPNIIYIYTNDTPSAVLQFGYLNTTANQRVFNFDNTQMALVYTTQGPQFMKVSVSGTNVSLLPQNSATTSNWEVIPGTTQNAVVDYGYIVGNAGLTTINLPASADIGDTVEILGRGAGGWILEAAPAQIINIGAAATSAGGTLASANRYDSVRVVCVLANATWNVTSVFSTGLTIT